MTRERVQCPSCAGDVEVFVEGTIVDVELADAHADESAASQVLSGLADGLAEKTYNDEECPTCGAKLRVVTQ